MAGNGIFDRLQNLDSRVFYWILFISLALPFLSPLNLPITVTPTTQAMYEGLRSVKAGEVVVLSINSGVSSWGDCLPGMVASVKQVLMQQGKLVVWSVGFTDADITWAKIMEKTPEFAKLKEGEDYVYFGYMPSQETNVALLRDDISKVFTQDMRKVPLDQIPLMKNVKGAADIKLVLSSDTGDAQRYYINQWRNSVYKTPVAEIGIAMNKSGDMPFFLSGDLFGLVAGSRGAAELEKLVGAPGDATVTMDSISVSHLLLVLAILLANVSYLVTREKK